MSQAPPEYIVQQRDTLSKIASRIYGKEIRWVEVYAYNSHVIGKNAHSLTIGTRLLLPPADFRVSEKERAAIIKTAARLQTTNAVMSKSMTTRGGGSTATSKASGGGAPPSRTTNKAQTNKATGTNAGVTSELVKILRSAGVEWPEKFLKFLQIALKLDEKMTTDLAERLAKKGSSLKAIEKLAKAFSEWQKGNGVASFAYMAEGVASGWGLLTDAQRSRVMDMLLKPLRGKFSDLADILKMANSTEALKVVSGLMRGEVDDVVNGLSGVVKHLLAEKGVGKERIAKLIAALVGLLPERMRDKTLKKIMGRKVPIVGTLIVGVTDVYNIIRSPTDWTKWAGLISTAAGALPGPGTLASAAIDIGLLVEEVRSSVKDIQKMLQVPVTPVK